MVVRTQCKGHVVTGLRVGTANAQRFFPRDILVIELQLDHLRIECRLSPEFWQGAAEIRDPRLCAWLESKQYHSRSKRIPAHLAMIPTGNGSFKLDPEPWDRPARLPQARPAATAARVAA